MLVGNDGNETWYYANLNINNNRFSGQIGTGLNRHRDENIFTVPVLIKAP